MKAHEQIIAWIDSGGRKRKWLAEQVQVNPADMTQWLRGNRIPRQIYRSKLAEVTGLPVAEREAWE
jgi:hypothetical protein